MKPKRSTTRTRSAGRRPKPASAYNGGFQDLFQGTTAIYVIEGEEHADIFLGDYDIEGMPESWPEQLRARRLRCKQEGELVPKLPDASLAEKVLIAFGPNVSPQRAIVALKRAIESIEGIGLLIGRDPDNRLTWEEINGQIRID